MTAVQSRPRPAAGEPTIELGLPVPAPEWPPRRRREPLPALAVAVTRSAVGLALLALWSVFFMLALGGLETARNQQLLYQQMRERIANQTEPIGAPIDPGTPVALVEAPAIGMRYVVVEGTAPGDLRAGPGHRRDSPLPGQVGWSILYGRAAAFGGPFGRVTELRRGDIITVTTGQGTFDYRVEAVRHAGDPNPAPLAIGAGRLTLATAEGTSWRRGWAPNRVVYVDAALQGTPQPAPAGRPTAVPKEERAMATDGGALVPLVLWLQALLLAAAAAAWATARWGGPPTWLACSPIVLAALWGASESAAQLLPNLM
jgi:sortase A